MDSAKALNDDQLKMITELESWAKDKRSSRGSRDSIKRFVSEWKEKTEERGREAGRLLGIEDT